MCALGLTDQLGSLIHHRLSVPVVLRADDINRLGIECLVAKEHAPIVL